MKKDVKYSHLITGMLQETKHLAVYKTIESS